MSHNDLVELNKILAELARREADRKALELSDDQIEKLDCRGLSRQDANKIYRAVMIEKHPGKIRWLCKNDLFFLLVHACRRSDIDRDWLYDRCREVQANPNGYLDLWAREHYKSTTITFGKSIQDILNDPEITIGIFSHTRPIAKDFLKQIKTELEQNQLLKDTFPDILYQDPENESPKWSLDSGIRVKRNSNPKEETVEAWGVVDGQPTGKHFKLLIYDDIVTKESVSTPEQIKKTTSSLELSYNLGAHGGYRRFIGTRYHLFDTYREIMERGTVIPRIHPATHNGKMDGEPVFLSKELLFEKRRDMGPYTFGTQMLQDPVADKAMSFKVEWLKYYDVLKDTSKWNRYILADPAGKKKKTNDYTVMVVIGLAPDGNYYLLDGLRDRLNLTQRATKLFELHAKWKPLNTGYEEYGMQADIEHIEYVQEQENYRFKITPLGGGVAKEDRIKKLIPIYETGRFYLPRQLNFVDYEGNVKDFIEIFIKHEYTAFPVCTHDDMFDCKARILEPDLDAKFPIAKITPVRTRGSGRSSGWVG